MDYDAEAWFLGAAGLGIARGENDDGGWLGSIPQEPADARGRGAALGRLGTGRACDLRRRGRTVLPSGATPGEAYQLLDLFATWAPDRGPLAGGTFRIGLDNALDEGVHHLIPTALAQNRPQPRAFGQLQVLSQSITQNENRREPMARGGFFSCRVAAAVSGGGVFRDMLGSR